MNNRKGLLRWRKRTERTYKGGATYYELWRGSDRLAVAAPIKGGWYWYGVGINTAHKPAPLADVKVDAVQYMRETPLARVI